MQETLRAVLELQPQHSSENTPAMQQRGLLVRHDLPRELLAAEASLAEALGQYGNDVQAQGSDGTGLKALVPWARVFSRRMSPRATDGWYVVYLFHPDGAGVSLCLSHGSTVPQDGNFKTRSRAEVVALMEWAATVVGDSFEADPSVSRGLSLGRQRLAAAYENTTVFSKFYPASQLPDDEQLYADLLSFCRVLGRLYFAQDAGLVPGSSSPEVVEALRAVQEISTPFKHHAVGQGWGLSQAARIAVELRAMEVAESWLAQEGFEYKDVSSTDSCDFRAERDGEPWVIEVKGTTGGAGSILVTRNEVALHEQSFPRNALVVVHGIKLDAAGTASGGTPLVFCPWEINDDNLRPTAFEYRIG